MSDAPRLVLSTVATHADAERIARALVGERLAACVNIIPALQSIYWWNDAVQRDEELLLLIKCVDDHLAALQQRLRELHPYEVPEFVVIEPRDISPDYLSWLRAATKK